MNRVFECQRMEFWLKILETQIPSQNEVNKFEDILQVSIDPLQYAFYRRVLQSPTTLIRGFL